ncbi:MAG: carboxypeptidase-like regulatory domain-containing protein [Myxococcales bacterium]|nr:carboxypeptidase-like regulatory domain-containing protein [Myxococcales bacterium]
MRAPNVWMILALVGCGGGADGTVADLTTSDTDEPDPNFTEQSPFTVRVDVLPASVLEEDSSVDDLQFRALPQSKDAAARQGEVVTVNMRLRSPVQMQGSVTGFAQNPVVGILPGLVQPVAGTVFLDKAGSLQSYATRTDDLGEFSLWLVPQDAYVLSVVPDDPIFPLWSTSLVVEDEISVQDLDITESAPIYGVVSSTEGPVMGAHVYAEDPHGVRSASAVTDDNGHYTLHVQRTKGKQGYAVVCEGRELFADPVWRQPGPFGLGFDVGEDGLKIDFPYPTALPQDVVDGRVVTDVAQSLTGTTVRFVAQELTGYEGLDVSWVRETAIDLDGSFIARVPPGLFRVDVLPPAPVVSPDSPDAAPALSPFRLVDLALPADVGTLELLSTVEVSGTVASGEDGRPLAGASIDCSEIGFAQRSWFTTSQEDGRFTMHLPDVDTRCIVGPPGGVDLARRRFVISPGDGDDVRFELMEGVQFVGQVQGPDDEPERFAAVEIRDLGERLLAFGLTDEDGNYQLRVELEDGRVSTTPE